MVRCENGHYYDEKKYMLCPYCGIFTNEAVTDRETSKAAADDGLTQKRDETSDDPTVDLEKKNEQSNYVTGWLVCTEGKDRGKDYRIFRGNNFVGRDYDMDIRIENDGSISRRNHGSVVYEERESRFYVVPMENVIRLDGKLLDKAAELKSGQEILIGNTTLVFIAFCERDRRWKEKDEK